MREIKFRAASAQAPEDVVRWIYGAYVKHLPYTPAPIANGPIPEYDYEYAIVHDGFSDWQMPRNLEATPIRPETVGEYTGLHDRNGKEIYEGDVLRDENGDLYKVKFDGGQFQPLLRYGGTQVAIESIVDMADYSSVIGNIYENPELLGARDEQK
ncbi:YopX family protein [Lacticaseibacillus pantheris]|jgi:hypothetical protein|uniref:YopX family protein n=1 Tax=Lacticaseibacillus pantheris TaxID=171523 RepID=UPI0006D0E8D7|nr:YopX family protein [Lacticaseibacillus pantheris]